MLMRLLHFQIIQFDKCNLSQFDQNFFDRFVDVHRIDISDVGSEKLTAEIFPKSLDLIASKNRLTEIPNKLFANLEEIVYIDFSNNRIKQIHPSAFTGLRKLELLDLARNEISSLDEHLFRDTGNLTTLDLSHNMFLM